VGGVLVICLSAVIHYHMCENMFLYTRIQSPHPSAEKDLRIEHKQRDMKDTHFTACQKLDNKLTLFLTVVLIPNSLHATPAF